MKKLFIIILLFISSFCFVNNIKAEERYEFEYFEVMDGRNRNQYVNGKDLFRFVLYKVNDSGYEMVNDIGTIEYSIDNPEVAQIVEDNLLYDYNMIGLKFLKTGKVNLNAKLEYRGTIYKNYITINVYENPSYLYDMQISGDNVINVNETTQLKVELFAFSQVFDVTKDTIWKSSDENIVVIDENGLVKAISPGNAIITASYNLKGYMKESIFEIQVLNNNNDSDNNSGNNNNNNDNNTKHEETIINNYSIYISSDNYINPIYDVRVNDKIMLNASLMNNSKIIDDITSKVSWKSSDTSLATIDENGIVNTLKEGKVTITATYKINEENIINKNLDLNIINNQIDSNEKSDNNIVIPIIIVGILSLLLIIIFIRKYKLITKK